MQFESTLGLTNFEPCSNEEIESKQNFVTIFSFLLTFQNSCGVDLAQLNLT